ncbi:MAG TPA: sigma-70 family RNA polymerase sigma factor [Chitinophagaceae bacterium]|nr:sigma-70 family RNA polymerase sigma factor [Chitinophagaceae bacterium]
MEQTLHTEEILLQRFKKGEEEAFQEIYEKYVPELLSYAALKLSSLEEARDLVHDIFLSFYERRKKITIETSIKTYLFSALKYKIIDHIRKNIRKEQYYSLLKELLPKTEKKVFNDLVYKDLNAVLDKGITCLPKRLRETFILSRKEHLSISEIAARRNISEQTVKNQLTTAMKRLRPMMEKIMIWVGFIYVYLF